MREWRKTHPLTPEQRKKMNARSYARVYLKRGLLVRQSCLVPDCQEPPEMHHKDYDRPLDVYWICRNHHLEHHRTGGIIPCSLSSQ